VAKKPDSSRIPSAVGAIPVVGDLMKQAETQAQWMQDLVEQNARLIGQFPATMKSFNDSLERFNQTIGRLDRAVTRIESASKNLTGPVEKLAGALDPKALRELPETLDAIRREAVPALRAATDTQRQVALLAMTIDRVVSVLSELPGMGILRRIATGRPDDVPPAPPAPAPRGGPGA
jgi:ABC-type transporter Mla subunit MlaD